MHEHKKKSFHMHKTKHQKKSRKSDDYFIEFLQNYNKLTPFVLLGFFRLTQRIAKVRKTKKRQKKK